MMQEIRITTVDNPYNPFTDWDEWFFYDLSMGYYTCERLARSTAISDQLSEAEMFEIIEKAIEDLMKYGCFGKKGNFVDYKKVFKYEKTDENNE